MWSRNQRHSAARLFLKRLGLLALFILALLAASGVWGVFQKERETAARRAEAEALRVDLETREKKLRADITTLQSDRGLEATLRAQYGLAEEGEGLIVIVEPPAAKQGEATSTPRDWFSTIFWWF